MDLFENFALVRTLPVAQVCEKKKWQKSNCCCVVEELFFNKTNLQNKGLISADRGTKATLVRTIPRSLFKSSTEDLSLPIFELVIQHRLLRTLR